MTFERMELSESDIRTTAAKPEVRLSQYGLLTFNGPAVAEHGLAGFDFCELFYEPQTDKTRARVEIMFYATQGGKEMRLPIKHRKRKGSKLESMLLRVKNTFRARGIMMPQKTVVLPYVVQQNDIIIIGLPANLTPTK